MLAPPVATFVILCGIERYDHFAFPNNRVYQNITFRCLCDDLNINLFSKFSKIASFYLFWQLLRILLRISLCFWKMLWNAFSPPHFDERARYEQSLAFADVHWLYLGGPGPWMKIFKLVGEKSTLKVQKVVKYHKKHQKHTFLGNFALLSSICQNQA